MWGLGYTTFYNGESNGKEHGNEMETGVIDGFKEPSLSYYIVQTNFFTICTHYGNLA